MIVNIKAFLDSKVLQYNRPEFIPNDPVCIPHLFSKKQDIEIMGLWAAVLAWGQRVTIINKCHELIKLMDGTPYDFIMGHEETDLKKLLQFKHRTFNDVDTLYFISFFRHHYSTFESLESAFLPPYVILRDSEGTYKSGITANAATPSSVILSDSEGTYKSGITVNAAIPPFVILSDSEGTSTSDITANAASPEPIEIYLNHFRQYFFSLQDFPNRTKKHISSPSQKSTCKRLNMFLRWMVRKDDCGVDFGLWDKIKPADLICPCDLHVDRVARKLNLITRKQTDWQTAIALTARLREFDPIDPVKYDFALFGLGIMEKF